MHKKLGFISTYQQQNKLMSAPLTMEDTQQFENLPLIGVLRPSNNQTHIKESGGDAPHRGATASPDAENRSERAADTGKPTETVVNPPSFYENDIETFKKKFAKSLAERKKMKALYGKTQNLTCLTRNTNVKTSTEPISTLVAGE